jgi:hypothetical protein
MKPALQNSRRSHILLRPEQPLPPGKHAHYAPHLIGYALLVLALLLIVFGFATA